MTRVSWSDVGQRFYEAGSDRGVLYLDGQDGVPWNGLLGVSESPTGGEPRTYYVDGYKYLNLASAEEYSATIRAFSSPREFDACDGTAPIHNGLFATQQTRKSFGFTYRTMVGNDVEGLDHGYKIHLVYNALASSADRSYDTVGASTTPLSLSWSISTLAPIVVGMKPTAHFVVDSRHTPQLLLTALENILYGTATAAPRLITPQELVDLFKSSGPITAKNWFVNPSFERVTGTNSEIWRNLYQNSDLDTLGGSVTYLTNLSTNPNGVTGVGFKSNNVATWNVTLDTVTVTSHPQSILNRRKSMLVAGQVSQNIMSMYDIDTLSNTSAERTIGAWLYVNASGYEACIGNSGNTPFVPIPASTFVWFTNTVAANTYAAAYIRKITGNASELHESLITGVTVIDGTRVPRGTVAGGIKWIDPYLTAGWTGTANASTSTLTGVQPTSIILATAGSHSPWQYSAIDEASKKKIMRVVFDGTGDKSISFTGFSLPNVTNHTLIFYVRASASGSASVRMQGVTHVPPITIGPDWREVRITRATAASGPTGLLITDTGPLNSAIVDIMGPVTLVAGTYYGQPFSGKSRPRIRENLNWYPGDAPVGITTGWVGYRSSVTNPEGGYCRATTNEISGLYSGGVWINTAAATLIATAPGESWIVSGEVRVPSGGGIVAAVQFYDSNLAYITSSQMPASTEVPSGTVAWTETPNPITMVAPAKAAYLRVGFLRTAAAAIGDVFDYRYVTAERISARVGAPFSSNKPALAGFGHAWADTANASVSYLYDSDLSVSYVGAVNNSESIVTGEAIAAITPSSGVRAIRSTRWKKSRDYSMRLISIGANTNNYVDLGSAVSNNNPKSKLITAMATRYLEAPLTGTLLRSGCLTVYNGTFNTSPQPPNVAGEFPVRTTGITGSVSGSSRVLVHHGGVEGSGDVWWDLIGVFEGDYLEEVFDGSFSPANGHVYNWGGLADQSFSFRQGWGPI